MTFAETVLLPHKVTREVEAYPVCWQEVVRVRAPAASEWGWVLQREEELLLLQVLLLGLQQEGLRLARPWQEQLENKAKQLPLVLSGMEKSDTKQNLAAAAAALAPIN